MEGFDKVRLLARKHHAEASASAGDAKDASALLGGATAVTGIERQAVPDNDPVLCGAEAVLEPNVPAIFYKRSAGPELAAFYQAHEFAHYWLHSATGTCSGSDIDLAMPEERTPLGIQRVEGYGPRERRECQANVFAREFLLPADEARRLFREERVPATQIAESYGLPFVLVHQQLAKALFVPDSGEQFEEGSQKRPDLDDSQRAAAEADDGPHLIEAGPGTGKTHTLIARIEWLLQRGADPESILALTFSNKSAEELRERAASAAPTTAPAIWAGTFHAFGLELLRKFGHLIDLPPDLRMVDPDNALLLLEERLPKLPLNHYLNLYEPAVALRDILTAISRAKDELIDPAQYRAFGEAMLAAAGEDEDEREAAEKAIEVAAVFASYEEVLAELRAVDFSDLILKPIALLRDHPAAAAEIRAQYRHILVDEYQDVNRASGVLLQLLADNAKSLWVVGDARQSIYRFRGASPGNIRKFEEDFPGAKRLPLQVNYRSQAHVVRLVESFVPTMRASADGLPAKWEARRGDQGGEVRMEVAVDLEAEAAGIAQEIECKRAEGFAYCDQAVLCRSHTNLARFASQLEANGVPILYLGNLFERPEVRDMLALISFTCEPKRGGLLRVAEFPEYSVGLEDVRRVLAYAQAQDIQPLDALLRLDEVIDLSANGKAGLELLAKHLQGIDQRTTPTALLFDYLFTCSCYLDSVLADRSIAGQQQRLALFQLLQFTIEYEPSGRGNPRRQLLQWIRRLESFGDERQLRQLPAAAGGIDAVRLMTVHASKGLEFPAVYLPGLAKTLFPVSRQHTPCPPPEGMLDEDPKESHDEEEECLFFVALSRARDVLCLSRAQRYGANRNPSPLLTRIAPRLPHAPDSAAGWRASGPAQPDLEPLEHAAPAVELHAPEDLDQYIRCPLAYLYQRVLGLSGERDDNAYVRFHRAVYAVLRWMGGLDPEQPASEQEARSRLKTAWSETGPTEHPYESVYWTAAVAMVERAAARRASGPNSLDVDWVIERPQGRIQVRPDHVEAGPDGPVVRRLRTGRPSKNIDDNIYALYHHAAAQEFGSAKIEALFLTTDQSVEIPMSNTVIANRLKKYDEAIAGISAGDFPPKPNARVCPRCPQYFICPAVPGAGYTESDS